MGNNLGKMSRQIASNDSMDIDNQFYNETAEHDAHDVNASQYQDLPTPQPSYIILEDGSRRCQGGNREKMCRSCGEWIDLGPSERGDAALVNHEGRKRCLANVKRENHRRSIQQAAAALEEVRRNGPHVPMHFHQSECSADAISSSIGQTSSSL